jgi:acetate---CoA ligase (ADP-forming) subunit alpha
VAPHLLDRYYRPRHIALIGARTSPGFGFGIPLFWKKRGWLEKAFLVNPRGGEIQGRKVYSSVSELPEGIDLAVVIVPAPNVREVVIDLGRKGIRAAIVESAGFAETGEEGARRQADLLATASASGIRLLGPNCVGIVNTANQLATIEVLDASLEPGPVAIIAQSGVFGNILLDYLPEAGLRISKVATLGNKVDLDEVDFLEYFGDDPETRVILIYLEGTRDGRRLLRALRETCRKKPVVILKSGRTPLGRMATLSHTASLSGEDGLYDAAFSQAGAIRAASLAEMIEIAKVLTTQPPMPGPRVGVLTTSGSLGAMAADAIFEEGLRLASWSPQTFEQVRQAAPAWVNVKNPMDIGPSGIFPTALKAVFSDPNADGYVLIPVIPCAVIDIWLRAGVPIQKILGDWAGLRTLAKEKPVVQVLLGGKEWLDRLKELGGNAIAPVSSPETAAKTLAALAKIHQGKKAGDREQ